MWLPSQVSLFLLKEDFAESRGQEAQITAYNSMVGRRCIILKVFVVIDHEGSFIHVSAGYAGSFHGADVPGAIYLADN